VRVMILTADYSPGAWSGIGVAVEQQARALAALGVEVHVLVAGEARFAAAAEPGPTVHHLSRRRCPIDPRGFDGLHVHSLALSELALEIRHRFGVPLAYTVHSLLHLELEPSPLTAPWCAVQRQVLAASDRVVFVSEADRGAALALLPELRGRSRVVPNGVAPLLSPTPSRPTSEGPIVFAGRFARSKGIELLAQLMPRLLARRSCRFVLAGGHGDAGGHRLVRDLERRFPETCQAVGWLERDALSGLFARAGLVLIPSLYEPFGLVALEAMSVGAPVLAAAVGGLLEVVTEASGGRLVGSRDPDEWADAASHLLSSSTTTRELRARGPAYVASRYDAGRLAQRLIDDVYADL
jgi:glycosyltransferase involved in cell wall biosynthesis